VSPIDGTDGAAPAPHGALGAVLAGGRGSRIGGAKPTADLAGRPLISYPLAALAAAGIEAFVVAKSDTELPISLVAAEPLNSAAPTGHPQSHCQSWSDAEVLVEPAEPTHPLAGIVAALRHAGRPLVILGCDFPFAPPTLLRALADAPDPSVVPAPGGNPQPLMARWSPKLLPLLEAALDRQEPLRRTVAMLRPRLLDEAALAPFGDPARAFFNVNTTDDLRAAAALL
jgi:molybdopterin-guanine dinucleotide biosynthesis protein A